MTHIRRASVNSAWFEKNKNQLPIIFRQPPDQPARLVKKDIFTCAELVVINILPQVSTFRVYSQGNQDCQWKSTLE